jgi:O-antigen/teichoic acid export membrane protein
MSKAADMAGVSAKGSFHLFWGLVVSTVITSVATIFVARLLGSDLYGLYGIVLIAPNLLVVFRDWGINSAMVKYTAQFLSEDRALEVRNILVSGIVFETVLGIVLSAVCFLLSGYLATDVFHRPEIVTLIQMVSIGILAGGMVTTATAAFTGIERMELNSLMLICQSIVRTTLMISLVIAGLGTSGAVLGYTFALVTAGLIGLALVFTQYRKLPKHSHISLEIRAYIKVMLFYGIPLSISDIISGFKMQYYAFLLPIFYVTDNIAIGNYGIASTFIVLITFFATPITTLLFPAFSKLNFQTDRQALENVYRYSVKYASLIVVPVAAIVMSLAEPAISTLFGETYSSAPLFLALLAITYIYAAFGSLSNLSLINSQGKTKLTLYLSLISAAIGVPLAYILIMNFGVLGLIVTTLVTTISTTAISLYWIRKHYALNLEWRSSAKILFSSAFAAILTYFLVSDLGFISAIKLFIGVIFFAGVYFFAIILTHTLNQYDIENLRGVVSGLGPLGRILKHLLDLIQRLTTAFRIRSMPIW